MLRLPRLGLRRRIALIILPSLLLLMLASAAAQYLLAVRPLEHQLDRSLEDVAVALASRMGVADNGNISFDLSDESAELLDTDALDDNWFTAFNERFEPIAGEQDLKWPGVVVKRGKPYFFDTRIDGLPVRAVAVLAHCGVFNCGVIAASTMNKRSHLIRAIQLSTLLPMALAGVLSALLVWFGLRGGLLPLERLSGEVSRRSSRDLSPISVSGAPSEVLPLVAEINRLMTELGEAGLAQQKFLATAAHQLRTPLAGLQSRIELALLETRDGESRARLADIHESAVRSARLAVQLLSLARVEPGASRVDERSEFDLARLIADLVDEWVPRAIDRQIDLGFELEHTMVTGSPLMLRELVVNLIHNALEYTPEGGRVTVRAHRVVGEAVLEVQDNGPGIPPAMRERVIGRFVRLPGTRGTGSGLGLAIVHEIAQAHQARMTLEDAPEQGLLVRVCFPPAQSAGPA